MSSAITNAAYGTLVHLAPSSTALANAARFVSGPQGSDTTGSQPLTVDLILGVNFTAAPSPGTIDCYVLRAVDGTNYPYGSTSITPQAALLVGSFIPNAATGQQYVALYDIPGPPGSYEVEIVNNTGQSMPAGWTLDLRPHSPQVG